MKLDLSFCDPVQAAAVREDSGRDILVSASAGAGKTRVLVTRVLKRCIEDHIPLTQILAITFTEAAAEEMKSRVSADLHKLLMECTDAAERQWIEEQIASLPAASITTIDAFCLNLIRTYGSLIGLNPACGSNVLTSAQNRSIFHRSYENILSEEMAAEHDKLMDLMISLSVRCEDYDTLFDVLMKIIRQADTSADPDEWYHLAESVYPFRNDISAIPQVHRTYFLRMLLQKAENAAAILKQMQELAKDYDTNLEKTYASMSILCENAMAMLQEGMQGYPEYRKYLFALASTRQKKPKDERLADLRDRLHDQIDDLLSLSYPQEVFEDSAVRCAQRVHLLLKLAKKMEIYAKQIKQEEAVLDFSDMERYALQILTCSDSAAVQQICSSWQEIMVDEFQDTSILQNTIISCAAGNHPVFRVGDVKQSIYRFRQARPQLFRSMLKDERQKVFRMNRNYRSHEQIIAFTNLLFSRIMNVEGMEDRYTEEDTAVCGRKPSADQDPHVHLVLISPPDDAEGKPSAAIIRNQKAECISAMIQEQMKEKNLSYHDFAVLCRSHQDQIAIRRALQKSSVPCAADTREGFYSSDLCRLIHALLTYMIDRTDQTALMAVLVSEFFGMSDEEIAQLILQMRSDPDLKECKEKDLCLCIRTYQPQIIGFFDHLLSAAQQKGLSGLLEEIACAPAADGSLVFYEALNAQNRADFDYLREMILQHSSMTLTELIAEMENGQDEKSSQASVTGKEDDVVQIATIHGSKGLQYRYVFLWGTGHSAAGSSAASPLYDHDLGIGIPDVNPLNHRILPTMQSLAIAEKITEEDLEEYTRVLYVGVTRAEEHLYIIDSDANVQERQPVTASFLKRCTGITGLITAAVDHNPGLNETGLLETIYRSSRQLEDKQDYILPGLSVPLRMKKDTVLPPLHTPSSYEIENSFLLPPLEISTAGTDYGTRMHEAAALLPDDTVWSMELIRSCCLQEYSEEDCRKLIAFDQSDLRLSTKGMTIRKECPFYYEGKDERLNGIFDYLAVGDHQIVLIDYKTDRKNEQQLKDTYCLQIAAYRRALQGLYPGCEIRTYLWSFAMSRAIELTE